ncbi:hypothetical protein Trydic_g6538 [Trypoxylus dichotomus]
MQTHGEDKLEDFLSDLNNVLVIKKQDGILGYTPKGNSYQPLHECAITPPQLEGVVKTLAPRSQRLADADHIILRTKGFTNRSATRSKKQHRTGRTLTVVHPPYAQSPRGYIKNTTVTRRTSVSRR